MEVQKNPEGQIASMWKHYLLLLSLHGSSVKMISSKKLLQFPWLLGLH
jgi:hypothetical protein